MASEANSLRRRFLALHLPDLGTDRIRRAAPAIPPERPLGTWGMEGPRRLLMAADAAAVAAGLRAGQALADAQAIVPGLLLEPDDLVADARALAGLALWARRYTPLVAVEGADTLLLDITGCAHFFGDEAGLMADALARLRRAGFSARGAVAGVAACAAALARAGGGVVLAAGEEARAVAGLPLAVALRGAGRGPGRGAGEALSGLERLGLKRVGEVLALPRGPLARRFGVGLLARLDALVGDRREALRPLLSPPELGAVWERAEPVVTRGGIELALEGLLETVCARLREAGRGARRLALLAWRVDGDVQEVVIGTGQGVRAVAHLRLLFRDRLEGLAPGLGFERLALEVRESEPMAGGVQAALAIAGRRDPASAEALARLLDRLRQRMRVRRVAARPSHWPEAMLGEGPGEAPPGWGEGPGEAPPGWGEGPGEAPPGWGEGPGEALPGWGEGAPVRMGRAVALGVVAAVPEGPPALLRWQGGAARVARVAGPRRLEGRWWLGEEGRRDFYRVELESGVRLWLCHEGAWSLRGRLA